MGQQMGKEAEPPLICSTENTVWPHPGRKREESRKTQQKRQRDKIQEEDPRLLCYSLTTILFTFTYNRAAKRSKRFMGNLVKNRGISNPVSGLVV